MLTGPGVLDKSMLGVLWTIAVVYGCLSQQILSQAQCSQLAGMCNVLNVMFNIQILQYSRVKLVEITIATSSKVRKRGREEFGDWSLDLARASLDLIFFIH